FLLLLHVGAGPKRADKFHARFGALLDELSGKAYQFVRIDTLLAPEADVYFRASQVGYRPMDVKVGVAFAKAALPTTFVVVDESSGATVHEGTVPALPGERWGRFPHHADLDFTAVSRPGRYRLQLGGARSLPLQVGPDALIELPDQ